jgi:hypothetical protein
MVIECPTMKHAKLELIHDFNFEVFGINSSCKPHKLAWQINQTLNVHLIKEEDLLLEFIKDNCQQYFIHYKYETEHSCYKLIKNKACEYNNASKPFLVPELKNYDYLFIINTPFGEGKSFLQLLKSISLVEYINTIEVSSLTSKENLIF